MAGSRMDIGSQVCGLLRNYALFVPQNPAVTRRGGENGLELNSSSGMQFIARAIALPQPRR